MIHELKTEQDFFEDIISGRKSFEVRLCDRPFEVGDLIALNEIVKKEDHTGPANMACVNGTMAYTGRCALMLAVYIMRDERFVKKDYCIIGLRPVMIGARRDNFDFRSQDRLYGAEAYARESWKEGDS